MSQKASNLKLRVLVGLPGVAVVLALMAYGGVIGARALALFISVGMLFEFGRITFQLEDQLKKRLLLVLTGVACQLAYYNYPSIEVLVFAILFLIIDSLFFAKFHTREDLGAHTQEMMFSVFGLTYLGFLPLYLPHLVGLENGHHWGALFFLTIWSVDTGAYFAGKTLGRHKLYPLISPNKTVEGLIGGIVFSVFIVGIYRHWVFPGMTESMVLILGVFVGGLSQIGDLCESLLKRAFAVKDSGRAFLGHGGFLDRFDSVVFSLPIMYTCVRLLGK